MQPIEFSCLDHSYPPSKYPEKQTHFDNIVLACPDCNGRKADNFPLDEIGGPLLLDPSVDDFSQHIEYSEDVSDVSETVDDAKELVDEINAQITAAE